MDQFLSSIPENTNDYYGKDGLLHCGKCHTPKEAFFAKGIALMGKNKHPIECSCQRIERTKQEALIKQQKHSDLVRRLKAEGFSDPAMLDWTFENDNGRSPQMHHAHRYVEQWKTMRAENLGLLLWGGVGTGKSFLAGCIANALMEQEVPVRMTNFARILNELNNSFSGRNDVVDKLCRYPLLIIDDFGMERGTEYPAILPCRTGQEVRGRLLHQTGKPQPAGCTRRRRTDHLYNCSAGTSEEHRP